MIPAVAHFIWYGARFPWTNELAVRSALERGGFERAVLHHDQPLQASAELKALALGGRLELRRIEPACLAGIDPKLLALHDALPQPAARANLLRMAILAREGGVYLDMDTVSVASLRPLLLGDAFCGLEHVVYPAAATNRIAAPGLVPSASLSALRTLCRSLPDGWRWFRRVEHLYPTAANNAVLGFAAGHPFPHTLLDSVLRLPESTRRRRYALGTHLLQRTLRARCDMGVELHPPHTFYPLGPVVSQHWFRSTTAVRLDELVPETTRVVHWYASLRNRAVTDRLNVHHIRARQAVEPFSALVATRLPELCA